MAIATYDADATDDARVSIPKSPTDLLVTIEPADNDSDLTLWAQRNATLAHKLLTEYGAIRFSGFRVPHVAAFRQAFQALAGDPITYLEQSSPRQPLGDKVYTSTEYDPDRKIFLHNEQSYNINFPQYISFYCEIASPVGGETPLANTRRILERIDPSVKRRLCDMGYLYVRNFGSFMSMPWQSGFQLTDPAALEDYCTRNQISYEWLDGRGGARLRTRQKRPVIARHPLSGESVWFNHLTFFHKLSLDPDLNELIDETCTDAERPHATYYGDGTPLERDVIQHLRQAYCSEETAFAWRAGDVLLLDNMLVSHGRRTFKGNRKIAVAMSCRRHWREVSDAMT